MLVAVQLSVLGLYLPPVFKRHSWIHHIRPRRSFHCRSTLPCDTRAAGALVSAGGRPTIRAGIVSPAGVQIISCRYSSAPDDHFIAGPNCRVQISAHRAHWWCWWAVQLSVLGLYLPPVLTEWRCHPIHPRRSFHCQSKLPCDRSRRGRVDRAGGCPTICSGIVSPAGVKK